MKTFRSPPRTGPGAAGRADRAPGPAAVRPPPRGSRWSCFTNSLTLGLSNYGVEFTFVQPKGFETSQWILDLVKERGCTYTQTEDLQAALMQKKAVDTTPKPQPQPKHGGKQDIIEVDLHINALLDDTRGMSNGEMLNYQLDKFREVMEQYKNKREQRIVFIHGKGDGVLRRAVLNELKRKYPACKAQDASFQEYGFGATLVTIKQ